MHKGIWVPGRAVAEEQSRCCSARQLTVAPSRALSLAPLQQTPRSHALRQKNHWTMRPLYRVGALLSGSPFPIMAARPAFGSQPSRIWQAWILCLLPLREGF